MDDPRDTPTTVLVVEDDPATLTFLGDNLCADGYEPLPASTARDALRLLEHKRPDLALIDLGLPDGGGLELLRRVRQADGLASRLDPALPVIIVTGRASELDRIRGFERGCDDYVANPLCAFGASSGTFLIR
jgi:DNA-binding response OmpR family regulator